MANEKQEWSILQVVCLVAGFILVTSIARFGFGFSGIVPSAIAGGLGAAFGTIVYEVIKRMRRQ